MAYPRKRKHQETPMPSRVQGDPTATWKSRIPPDRTFHFSRRIKPKVADHELETPAPAEDSCITGLRRFQKRNRLKARGYSKMNDTDLEEAEPLLGEETAINVASTTNNDGLSDFERIIPLGRGDEHSKSSAASTKPKKKKKKKGFLGIRRKSRAPEAAETRLPDKTEGNHFKTSFHGSHTTMTRDCDSSLGASSTLASSQDFHQTVDPPSIGGDKGTTSEQTLPSPKKTTGGIMDLPHVISVLNPSTDETNGEELQCEEPVVDGAQESSPKTFENTSEVPVAISDLPQDNEEKPKQREAAPNVSSKASAATKLNNKILSDNTDAMKHAEPKSQTLPVLETPRPDSSSVGQESSTTLDVTKNDKEGESHHTSHNSNQEPSGEETQSLVSADQSSTLTKANLLEHSNGEAAAAEEPTHNIELEEGDPEIPQPTLWRGETGFSTQIMGASPCKESDKDAKTVDQDSHREVPVEKTSKEPVLPSRSNQLASQQDANREKPVAKISKEAPCPSRSNRYPIPRRLLENFNAVATSEAPVIPNALGSQRAARSAKRKAGNMTQGFSSKRPKVSIDKSFKEQKSAFVCRTRPDRPRTETIGNSDDFKRMMRDARRTPFESANPKQNVPSSAKLLMDKPTGNGCGDNGNTGDTADWPADFDSTPSVKDDGDDDSLNDVASFFEDCPTDEKQLARNECNDGEKHLKHQNAEQKSKRVARSASLPAATSNLKTTGKSHAAPPNPPQNAPEKPPRNSSASSSAAKSACDASEASENSCTMLPDPPRQVAILHSRSNVSCGRKKFSVISPQVSIRLAIFLFYIYAVLWTRCNPGNSFVLRNNCSIINKIDPGRLEKQKRMFHRIWFSENPNLSLLESSKMEDSTMM